MKSKHPQQILKGMGRDPQKKWGQNFLQDSQQAKKIIEELHFTSEMGVLEIGPGLGAMTSILAESGFPVLAVELDDVLVDYLHKQFSAYPNVTVLHQDFLHLDREQVEKILGPSFQVIGNLPYNAATAMIFRLLTWRKYIPIMGLMLQKEVAERIQSSPGKKSYGKLSILPQNYYDIEILCRLRPAHFYPAPKVESIFLEFRRRAKEQVTIEDGHREKLFQQILNGIFQYRRKTLVNGLTRVGLGSADEIRVVLQKSGIDGKRRGETLSHAELSLLLDGFDGHAD